MLQEFELEIIRAVQSIRSPFFDSFFQIITMLGEQYFYILVFCYLYWCVSKESGSRFILTFLFSTYLNSGLKNIIMRERPIGREGVRSLRVHTATGSSFPSGHTQGAATFWFYILIGLKRRGITLLCILMPLLVALSRIYLGVHWPSDVLASLVIAYAVALLGRRYFSKITLLRILPLLLMALVTPLLIPSKDHCASAALLAGGLIGIYLERRLVGFIPDSRDSRVLRAPRWLRRIVKLLSGLFVLILLKEGLKIVLPETLSGDYIRYSVIGLWVALGAPALFKGLKI